jgi:NAD+ diphosphatase
MIITKSLSELGHIPQNILCLFYFNNKVLVLKPTMSLPRFNDIHFPVNTSCVFIMPAPDGTPILVADLMSDDLPDHFSLVNTREHYHYFNFNERGALAKTFGYVHWYRMHQFCGRCTHATIYEMNECALLCPVCQYYYYPKINPSMIVLVYRGRELLLARSPHFQPGIYSTLAGYVAPGETVEETVMREVKEEVNITVKNIRYAGSQSWPFPDTLMLGFYAEYESGEIQIDEKEIEAAAWFTPENLPPLPRNISIGWQLINGFIQNQAVADNVFV